MKIVPTKAQICVITKTLVRNTLSKEIIDAHKTLSQTSTLYPGCVYSNNYRESFKTCEFNSVKELTNVSLWNSYDMWKNWFESSDRHYLSKHLYSDKPIDEQVKIFKSS